MLLHQKGTGQGLQLQRPGLLPHVAHNGQFQLPDVLSAVSLCGWGGGQRSGGEVLHSLAKLVPQLPQAYAAGRHSFPDVLQLRPLHVVERAAIPGHLVTGKLNPAVCPVIQTSIQGHVVAGHVDVG